MAKFYLESDREADRPVESYLNYSSEPKAGWEFLVELFFSVCVRTHGVRVFHLQAGRSAGRPVKFVRSVISQPKNKSSLVNQPLSQSPQLRQNSIDYIDTPAPFSSTVLYSNTNSMIYLCVSKFKFSVYH